MGDSTITPNAPATKLGRVLREEGRKQVWLANQVGATETMVSQWVLGVHRPSKPYREKIAKALRRDPRDLFDYHDDNPPRAEAA